MPSDFLLNTAVGSVSWRNEYVTCCPSYLKGAKTCVLPSPGPPDTLMGTYSLQSFLSWAWFVGMWISDPIPVEKANLGSVTGSFPVRAHFSVTFKSPSVKNIPICLHLSPFFFPCVGDSLWSCFDGLLCITCVREVILFCFSLGTDIERLILPPPLQPPILF